VGGFRRTWLRRSPADIAVAGRRLGAEVAEMTRADLAVYPEPSDVKCPPCPFLEPCRSMQQGRDVGSILRAGYRPRPPQSPEEGRLGGRAWGMGRGAAPPRFPAAGTAARREAQGSAGNQREPTASPRMASRTSRTV
jgi:hypothetical protein